MTAGPATITSTGISLKFNTLGAITKALPTKTSAGTKKNKANMLLRQGT